MPSPAESWRPVVGFEGAYEVSTLGRVRSLYRVVPHSRTGTRTIPDRILSQQLRSKGSLRPNTKRYPEVELRDGRSHKRHVRKVHRLVLESFVGPRPDNCVACHANDDPTDNRLANLRWDTHSANTKDSVINGCHPQSRKTTCRKGHAYAAGNLYLRPDGGRGCRECRRIAIRKNRNGRS